MPRKRAPSQPDDWLARLDELCDSGDRRATATLLAAFDAPETSDERRAEIAVTLRALEDPRCAEPLMRTILDLELSADLRSLALDVHSGIPVDVAPRAQALAWARSGDVVKFR